MTKQLRLLCDFTNTFCVHLLDRQIRKGLKCPVYTGQNSEHSIYCHYPNQPAENAGLENNWRLKMGYKKVAESDFSGEIVSFENQGDDFEGVLQGTREIVTKNGPATIADFIGTDGEQYSIFLSAMLKRLVNSSLIGQQIKIEYLGLEKSQKTGRAYKNFEISVWEQ